MSPSANVLAIDSLDELKGSLGRFSDEVQGALNSAKLEIQRTLEWLQQRQHYWQYEVHRRQTELEQSRAALARCQASGDRDHPPNCSGYEQALLQAQVRLREAEAELSNVQQWTRLIQQSAADYQSQAQRLSTLVENEIPRAEALLDSKITTLQAYVGQAGIPFGSGVSEIGPMDPVSSDPTSRNVAKGEQQQGITWAEYRRIFEKWGSEGITLEELEKLKLSMLSDLEAGSSQEDSTWIYQILDSERFREVMKDSQEATDLRDAILAILKAVNYRRSYTSPEDREGNMGGPERRG